MLGGDKSDWGLLMGLRIRTISKSFAAACAVAVLAPAAASAATISVTTMTDEISNPGTGCSLREAVLSANTDASVGGCPTGAGSDTITIPAGTYGTAGLPGSGEEFAVTGDLDVRGNDALTITGTGKVVISGGGADRVFDHPSGTGSLEIRNVTIVGGNVSGVNNGGAILNAVGSLTLENVTLSQNFANIDGGALTNYASATLTNVTISGNVAYGSGGGVYAPGGSATTVRNSTIAGNNADGDASDNGDGGGFATMGTFNTFNTIIANNSDSSPTPANQLPDCSSGPGFFPRYTLIGNFAPATCLVGFDPMTNIKNQDPKLGPLADNGGDVSTRALESGSPAIDVGGEAAPDTCAATDARGVSRPQGPRCDLGAFELQPTPPPPPFKGKCAGKTATITGTAGRDVIKGTNKRDIIAGLGGNDRISGLGGNDLICGGAGRDIITGGRGRDQLRGDAGGDGLQGNDGNDVLVGAAGNDKMLGGRGRDRLLGGPGRDRMFGGPGRDRLVGGPGRDIQKQ